MGIEIERKFLLANEAWRGAVTRSETIRQNYLARSPGLTVRVRTSGDLAWLTVKAGTETLARAAFEYPVPLADAEAMLAICEAPEIGKVRHRLPASAGLTWEIDEFLGDLDGLIVAEIELPAMDTAFERPGWLGREVTGDPAYLNANLSGGAWRR